MPRRSATSPGQARLRRRYSCGDCVTIECRRFRVAGLSGCEGFVMATTRRARVQRRVRRSRALSGAVACARSDRSVSFRVCPF